MTIGDHTFTCDELLAWRADRANPVLDDNAHAALDFCQRWLAGQEEFVVQTSGSTGAPKPITLTRRQMEASALATAAALNLAPGDRTLVCLPTQYIAGRMMLVRGMVVGMPMTLVAPAAAPARPIERRGDDTLFAYLKVYVHPILYMNLRNRVSSEKLCF